MPVTADNVTLSFDTKKVLKNIGYAAAPTAPARILKMVNELARGNLDIARTSYTYIIRDILDVVSDHILIEGGIHLQSRTMAAMLDRCEKVALFVLTIGDSIEESAAELARSGSVLKASILEAIGSSAAESAAELLEYRISYEVSNQGLYTGRRFSPGYCDWPVDQQEEIFGAFQDTAGVELTDGCLMLPRKSISGIIGIGTRDSEITEFNPCTSCLKAECPGRRA